MDTDQTLTAEKPLTSRRAPRERTCYECGATVIAGGYTRVLCPECRAKSRAVSKQKYDKSEKGMARTRRSAKKWRETHPEYHAEICRRYRERHKDELNAKTRARYRENIEQSREMSKLRQRMYRNTPGAKLEYDKIMGRVQTCPRLHVTSSSLPCGQRPECWWGKPCEKCEGVKRAVNKGFDDWRYF